MVDTETTVWVRGKPVELHLTTAGDGEGFVIDVNLPAVWGPTRKLPDE